MIFSIKPYLKRRRNKGSSKPGIHEPDMHCMSREYLAEELDAEYREKGSCKLEKNTCHDVKRISYVEE